MAICQLIQQRLRVLTGTLAIPLVVAIGLVVTGPGESTPVKGDRNPEAKKPRVDQFGDPLPDQTMFRIGTTRLQHRGEMQSVAASEDGRFLASCGRDKVVQVWDAKAGRPVWKFKLPTWGPWALAFSRDGKELAAISKSADVGMANGLFRRWNLATGREQSSGKEAASHFCYHVALICRSDGTFLAAETVERGIHLYSPGEPETSKTLKGHTGRVMSLCFLRDTKTMVSLGDDGAIRTWNVADGKEVGQCDVPPMKSQGLQGDFVIVAASPDGKTLSAT